MILKMIQTQIDGDRFFLIQIFKSIKMSEL